MSGQSLQNSIHTPVALVELKEWGLHSVQDIHSMSRCTLAKSEQCSNTAFNYTKLKKVTYILRLQNRTLLLQIFVSRDSTEDRVETR